METLIRLLLSYTLSTQSFFVSTSQSTNGSIACTAWSPTNKGSYDSQERRTDICPNTSVILHRGGGNLYPWKSETFFRFAGWWRIWNDVGYEENTGEVTNRRTFREDETTLPGLLWLPVEMNPLIEFQCIESGWGIEGGGSWQSWADGCMVGTEKIYGAHCTGDPVESLSGPSPQVRVRYLGTAYRWLQDRREGSLNRATWHDIEILQKEDSFDRGETVEKYLYGRWLDPLSGRVEGLGLVGFSSRGPASNYVTRESHYLVDCGMGISCTNLCPDGDPRP